MSYCFMESETKSRKVCFRIAPGHALVITDTSGAQHLGASLPQHVSEKARYAYEREAIYVRSSWLSY